MLNYAQCEWESIFSGQYTDEQISSRLHHLRKLQHEAESHNFPQGLATKASLFADAQQEATDYFVATYDGVGVYQELERMFR
jgi:hypothetical protein